MQNEREHLNHLISTLETRIKTLPETGERPASNRLVKAYDICNRTVINVRRALAEIMGAQEAEEIINEAREEAEIWYDQLKK